MNIDAPITLTTINIDAPITIGITGPAGSDATVNAANVATAIPATGGYLSPNAITFADPFSVDVDNGTVQTITLTASTTLTAITNAANGQSGRLEITQGGIGGFVVTLPAAYTLRSGDEATISDLATGETAIVAWSTIDGSDFNLWIS